MGESEAEGDHDEGYYDQGAFASTGIGESAGQGDADDKRKNRNELQFQEIQVGDCQAIFGDAVGQHPGGYQVEQRVAGNHDECAEDQRTPRSAEHFG